MVGPGDLVGEISMFDGLPRSANVIAESELLLVKFAPGDFHLMFQLHSKWSMKVLTTLAERVEKEEKS